MGRKEHPLVWYYGKDPHFADLINGWLFHGAKRLTPENLSAADRRILTHNGKRRYQDRYRDLYKCLEHTAFRLMIGVEEQTYVNYVMPVRVMDYDSASYSAQIACIRDRKTAEIKPANDEFLSGFSKEDRLLPVITLVLYCGSEPWNGALSLYDLLDLEHIPAELMEYIADYPIHVLDIRHTPDRRLDEFPPDIRAMFLFIKYQDDPKMLMKKLTDTSAVSRDTYDTIADLVGERRMKRIQTEEEGGKIHMCKAIDLLIADGERRGEKRGFRLGSASERENTERERRRAEAAEARVRELEQLLNN